MALRLTSQRNASLFQVFRLGLGRAVRICLLLFRQNVQAGFSPSLSSGPGWDKMACGLNKGSANKIETMGGDKQGQNAQL